MHISHYSMIVTSNILVIHPLNYFGSLPNFHSNTFWAFKGIIYYVRMYILFCTLSKDAYDDAHWMSFTCLWWLLLLDPTLTLPNLTPLLERISWNRVWWGMDIPGATVSTIRYSGGDDSQHRRRCCEVYLSDHPAPSWKQVADALYASGIDGQECNEELEVIQKKYLRGESAVGII